MEKEKSEKGQKREMWGKMKMNGSS